MSAFGRRALDTACVLLLALAAALFVIPSQKYDGAANHRTLPASLRTAGRGATVRTLPVARDSLATRTVQGNPFSATRRTPVTQFMPSRSGGDPLAGVGDVAPPTGAPYTDAGTAGSTAVRVEPVPALYGIVSVDGERRALVAFRAGVPPRLFVVNERFAGFRVVAIEPDRVVVESSAGLKSLRLTRSALRDTSEILP